MHRQLFVPAQSSRHRIAALALYRALCRSADKIPLAKTFHRDEVRHPIWNVIKESFVKNRSLTSLRLVFASLTKGYNFLSLFSKARDVNSPEYVQVTTHLRSRQLRSSPQRKPDVPPAEASQPPFLVNVSTDDSPRYEPTYKLGSKIRRLNLCSTANGQPFLRLKKPQPQGLSSMINTRGRIFQKKIERLVQIDQELKYDAALEDQWDSLMAAQMRKQGLSVGPEDAGIASNPSSFSWSVQLSRLWWEWQTEKTWRDWVARGEALNQFVEEQKTQEKPPAQSKALDNSQKPATQDSRERPNVALTSPTPFPLITAIYARVGNAKVPTEIDPFIGPRWNALVQSERARMIWFLRKESANSKQNKAWT